MEENNNQPSMQNNNNNSNYMETYADDIAYFNSLPVGYRFNPTDEELIVYLRKKIMNEPLPRNLIYRVNIYEHHPEELTETYKLCRASQWYFFTPRNKKYPNGSRPSRAAVNGYWKPTGTDKDIIHENRRIGYRKSLDFYEGKHPAGKKTDWKMHEYTIRDKNVPSINNKRYRCNVVMKLDDWVLCRIYKNRAQNKATENNEEAETANSNPEIPVADSTWQYDDFPQANELDSTDQQENYIGASASSSTFNNVWNNHWSDDTVPYYEPSNHGLLSINEFENQVSHGNNKDQLATMNQVVSMEPVSMIPYVTDGASTGLVNHAPDNIPPTSSGPPTDVEDDHLFSDGFFDIEEEMNWMMKFNQNSSKNSKD